MDKQTDRPAQHDAPAASLNARAVLLGDRIVIDRSRQEGVVSAAPFCFHEGEGYVVVFRYGAIVFVGLAAAQEEAVLAQYAADATPGGPPDEERVNLEIRPGEEEGLAANGTLRLSALSAAHVLVVADILAKSVALARYEREIASVFDTIEPTASTLAAKGRLPAARKPLLKLIGAALLAQHRVSGRIAFAEKPDVLWEHPELSRLFARLEDEYEIIERGALINGKVGVIAAAAQTFTDMVDTARSTRLEILIVLLIFAELLIGAATLLPA